MRVAAAALAGALCVLPSCALAQRLIEPPCASFDEVTPLVPAQARVLIFTKTHGYRHASIPAVVEAVSAAAARRGMGAFATESGAFATPAILERLDVVVFASANGTLLSPEQEGALRQWVEQGGRLMLLHGAVGDFDRASPWWWTLIGARFVGHTLFPSVVQRVVHASPGSVTGGIPAAFSVEDEFYRFADVRVPAHAVVLRSQDGPLAWLRREAMGSVFVCALGHEEAVWRTAWMGHLLDGALASLMSPPW